MASIFTLYFNLENPSLYWKCDFQLCDHAPIQSLQAILSAGSYAEMARELQKHHDTIRARWEMGHWTDCKQSTCGVAGYQVRMRILPKEETIRRREGGVQAREVTCSVMVDGKRRAGDPRICTALASARPPETRPCHKEECPRWEASDWTEVSWSSGRSSKSKAAGGSSTVAVLEKWQVSLVH